MAVGLKRKSSTYFDVFQNKRRKLDLLTKELDECEVLSIESGSVSSEEYDEDDELVSMFDDLFRQNEQVYEDSFTLGEPFPWEALPQMTLEEELMELDLSGAEIDADETNLPLIPPLPQTPTHNVSRRYWRREDLIEMCEEWFNLPRSSPLRGTRCREPRYKQKIIMMLHFFQCETPFDVFGVEPENVHNYLTHITRLRKTSYYLLMFKKFQAYLAHTITS